jgi:GTP-binding protein HflX
MKKAHRIILVDVVDSYTHTDEAIKNLEELRSLVSTYRGVDIVTIIQHRTRPDKATFVGSGKAIELAGIVKKEKIDIVVINAIVKPTVLFNLTKILWEMNPDIQVWDRIDLILNIFDLHAQTTQAKLQIEIARMRHMGPRIYGLGTMLSRQGGGIGGRGIGETNIELMKRHWRDQIRNKKEELEKISAQHLAQLKRRQDQNLSSVSIVGYTNAGKTSLFNLLAKKKKIVENALFVTLDSVSGKLYLPNLKREISISDTIGFIKDLPSSLIDTFKSTLMESIHADVLLHVIDVADPKMNEKIEVVERILAELDVKTTKIIYVFNKVDAHTGDGKKILAEIKDRYSRRTPQFISVTTNFGIDKLITEIERSLESK